MKAEINKSIGNTFVITVDNKFFDIVFWKKASDLIDWNPTLRNLMNIRSETIEVKEKNQTSAEKLRSYTSKKIHWIDKHRSISEIIEMGVEESIIYIQTYDFKVKESQFIENENPKITYALKIKGFELIVNKAVFMHYKTEPIIKAKRAI